MNTLPSGEISEVSSESVRQFFLRGAAPSPIFLFRLVSLGIDSSDFLQTFSRGLKDLPWDLYDVLYRLEAEAASSDPEGFEDYQRVRKTAAAPEQQLALLRSLTKPQPDSKWESFRPYRRRAATSYELEQQKPFWWRVSELPRGSFVQLVKDERSRPREFVSLPSDVAQYAGLKSLLAFYAEIIHLDQPRVRSLRAVVHLMVTYAFSEQEVEPAPEGVHKDGSDYVITALVIERRNIVGGMSKVFSPGSRELVFERQLLPGEGLFHADQPSLLWHSVSAIQVADQSLQTSSYRAILGVDFLINNNMVDLQKG